MLTAESAVADVYEGDRLTLRILFHLMNSLAVMEVHFVGSGTRLMVIFSKNNIQ